LQDLARYQGSVSVIYNLKESGVQVKLSPQTLAAIFRGEITNWQQINVRYPQEDIRVVILSEKSLSNLIFTRYLNRITNGAIEASWQPTWPKNMTYAKTLKAGEVASIVDTTPGAIAYVSSVIAKYYDFPTVQVQGEDGKYVDQIN
jgi:phosphate transport system substrate-binding protein